ncbi:hypothetical protein DL771_009570 [Monosporascus sp. 5C6A]|nr:hypothetical protein DL771_009570 [Monosporascus sp. 5C6A]
MALQKRHMLVMSSPGASLLQHPPTLHKPASSFARRVCLHGRLWGRAPPPGEDEDGMRNGDGGTSPTDEEPGADAEHEHGQPGPPDTQRRGKPSPDGAGRSGISQAVADGRGHGGQEAERRERDRE